MKGTCFSAKVNNAIPVLTGYPFLFSALLRWVVMLAPLRVAYCGLRWGLGMLKFGRAAPDLSGLLVITVVLFRKPGLPANRRLFLFRFCMDTLFLHPVLT